MIFRELNRSKCKTYLVGCDHIGRAALIDPLKEKIERYLGALAYQGLKLELIIDTHTHADHRSGAHELSELTDAPVAMHRRAPAPHVNIHVEDGTRLTVGDIEMQVLHTPGQTPDSISLLVGDRVFTGDVLLIHVTGRCDFAGGDPAESYDSITKKLFALADSTLVYPAHDYRGHTHSTIGKEKCSNPRLAGQSGEHYVELMNSLGLPLPEAIQEVLQPNQTEIEAGTMHFPTLAQLASVRQLAPRELAAQLAGPRVPILLDVREPEEFTGELGHIRRARLVPLRELPERASVELAASKDHDVVVICRAGVRSTTAAAILAGLGFDNVSNLKGGMLDWHDAGLPVEH